MEILHNISLKQLNTFGIEAIAKYFFEINSIQDFQQLITTYEFNNHERLIIGGGSNMLLTQDIDGLVIKNNLLGKEILEEAEETVTVKIMSGENWHESVIWATDHGWGGFENLALIPGSVGATPVQNIGAYGVEIKDTIDRVGVIDMQTGELKELTNAECNFGYRDSIFKNQAKGKYFITYVIFRLSKIVSLNTDYGVLKNQLQEMGIATPTIQNVRDAVIAIRKSKLPDPKLIGNAGSFFKNPVVSEADFKRLQQDYPDMPFFDAKQGVKIPAGWLIEQRGWKGKRIGNVGVHEKQALVLVNYGNATGQEIKSLAEMVQRAVYEKFGIKLEAEVTMI
ncbi:MAG: UDP-N-acetylmuramate dehydrogenase [Candidatus Pacebacteria bacterium]|nr:UDP-N-acetylmuramate dehydrogenase [Candidatus Paceibacterota bacterium]